MPKDKYLTKKKLSKNIYLPKRKSFDTKLLKKKRTKSKLVSYVKNSKGGKKKSGFGRFFLALASREGFCYNEITNYYF